MDLFSLNFQDKYKLIELTLATVVIIFEPPFEPQTNTTSPFESKTIIGFIEDSGRLPGAMKFAFDGRNS